MWMWPSPRPDQNLIFGSFLLLVGPRLPGCAFCLRSTNPPPGSTAAAALSSFKGGGGSASESSESSPRLRFFFFLRLRSPPSSPSPSPFAFFEARKGSNAFRKSLLLSCGSAAPPSPSSSPSPSPSAPAPPPSTSGNGSASAFALRAAATSTAGVLGRMVVCSMSEKRGPSGSGGASGGGGHGRRRRRRRGRGRGGARAGRVLGLAAQGERRRAGLHDGGSDERVRAGRARVQARLSDARKGLHHRPPAFRRLRAVPRRQACPGGRRAGTGPAVDQRARARLLPAAAGRARGQGGGGPPFLPLAGAR
mmetsp:Transcript_26139/g.76598  ORF Transcript_26139/g.76598 Transcript_26139/m.76598 type:complete len:307 (-) Transcript_26139:72-992(-)